MPGEKIFDEISQLILFLQTVQEAVTKKLNQIPYRIISMLIIKP